jgi:multicomponent Na+:H+ antiporter subunit B
MPQRMREKLVLRVVAERFIPFVLLFAFYVQFHGDYGPGGGFQAGVIFAAGLILYAMIFGAEELRRVAPARLFELLAAGGVLIYASVGAATLLFGGNFLDYGALVSAHPVVGQHLGIALIEFGVGMTVAAVMTTIYYCFAGQDAS